SYQLSAISYQLSAISYQLIYFCHFKNMNQKFLIMRNFRNLSVWEKSHELTLAVYKSTALYPKEEIYGLTSQMRRSASSVPSNIAEGCGRNTQSQLAYFLNIGMGSASELEYQLILSKDLEFISNQIFKEQTNQVTEVKRMLTSLHQKVSRG
ncbi:MAG: four helix bundle protein, partial [Balneolaceae bacterium]